MNESVKNNNTNLRERFNELYQLESINFNVNDIFNNHQFEYEADLLTNNNISTEIKKIPLRMICEEAGLNENQTNLILQLNENISREFIIDDWNSKLFKILAYILRLNFNQLTLPLPNLGRNQFSNFIDNVPKIQLPQQMVTYNNYIGTELQTKNLTTTTTSATTATATTNDDIRDCNENFAREAQNVCRNKDLYLMLVNTAVYGNFNYKYYENLNNYHKAAEYFALSGFGDSLDSTYQFSEYDLKSSPQFPIVKTTTTNIDNNIDDKITICDKSKLLNSSFTNDQVQTNRNNNINNNNQQPNNNNNNNSGAAQTILNQFQPAATFFGINFPYHSQIIPPAQNFLPKTALNFLTPQQILMQSNQPTNFLTNYPTVFQPTQPMLLTNALPMSSPYFNACFNETHINTSIIQQQQQYNVIGNNSGPYDMLIYAQMLQKTQQITQTIFANSKLEQQQQQQQQQQRPQQLNTNLANLVQISDSINIARQMNFNSTQNFLNLAKSAATNQLTVAAAAAAAAAASSSATVSSNATEPSSSAKSENSNSNNNDKSTFQGK